LSPLLILSALCGIHQAILKRSLNYKPLAIQSLASTVVGGMVAVYCAFRGYGVWSLVAQQLASALFTAGTLWMVSKWRPGFAFSFTDFRELAHYSFHITASAFLDFFNRRSDDFLIGFFLGTTVLGYYSLAYRLLLTFTRLINAPFNSVAFSAFARLQGERVELRRLFNHLTHLTGRLAFSGFLGLAALAPDFLQVLFGAQWKSAAPVLRILCFVGVLHSIAFLHGAVARAAGRASWQMWFTLGGALTNVIGFCYFVRFGVIYVAAWYVASAYLWLTVDLSMIKGVLGHRTASYLRGFTVPALKGIAVCAAVFVVLLLCPSQVPVAWRFALELLAGATVVVITNADILRNPRAALRVAQGQS
jgi:PST family polysaccharide transporter